MSELKWKWKWAYYPYLDNPENQKESALKAGYIKVVDKSEADKVIAEKDKEIAELKEQVHDYAQGLYVIQARAEKIIRHHKYKRCMAMAKWCMTRYNEWCAYYPTTTTKKMKFLDKWQNRWLKLADKFKEGK